MSHLYTALPDLDTLKDFLTEGSAPFVPDITVISDASLTRNLGEGYEWFQAYTGWNPVEAESAESARYFDPPRMSEIGWVLDLEGGLADHPSEVRIDHDRADAGSGQVLTIYRDYDLMTFGRPAGTMEHGARSSDGPFYLLRLKVNPGRALQSIMVTGYWGMVLNGQTVPMRVASSILRAAAAATLKDQMGPGGVASRIKQGPVEIDYGKDTVGAALVALKDQAAKDAAAYVRMVN